MKKIVIILFAFCITANAQDSVIDTLEIQNLEEVIVSSTRVKENIPIAFNNVSKQEISKRNLGQDIPILLNFLPNVVTTSDAGALTAIGTFTILNPKKAQAQSVAPNPGGW